jgi:hypothetical protein
MRRLVFLLAFSSSLSFTVFAYPAGDQAIIDLAMANVACAAVQRVNPEVVDSTYNNYFGDSVYLYQKFHNITEEKSEQNQKGFYNILTSERAIKAQSLNSVAGATKYLSQYLVKTDAGSCNELKQAANRILAKYNEKLL